MDRFVTIHYHEIGLKGKNRAWFENKLKQNIKKSLQGLEYKSLKRISGRLLLNLDESSDPQKIKERLKKVFGIAYFALAYNSEQDIEKIKKKYWEILKDKKFKSFAVDVQRSKKDFPLKSPEIERKVGSFIKKKSGSDVDLENPKLTCHIEIVEDYAFIYTEKIDGAGGMPVGTSGKVVCLLSSGFDSPVAAYKIMKRGAEAVFIHFHNYPYTSKASIENTEKLAEVLNNYQYNSKLYLAPFTEVQKKIVAEGPEKLRVILYRRMMLRIAEEIAKKEKALALATGESLAQVASQTLENLFVTSQAVKYPIFRPLIGDDKEEVIALSQKIGTYEISKQPYEDCCSYFVPKHPETKADLHFTKEVEKLFDIKELKKMAMDKVEIKEF